MENRMRDLEQIQEEDGDRTRRLGSLALAVTAVVGLTFAVGVVVGKAAMPDAEEAPDPLAQLEGLSSGKGEAPAAKTVEAPKIQAADLTFPRTLVEEDRPEVLEALEEAAREQASLEAAEAAVETGDADPEAAAAVTAAAVAVHLQPDPDHTEPADPSHLASTMPAAVAAGPAARALSQSARIDPMVAAAIPQDEPRTRAPKGMEGKYTLQVISYNTREPAESFADGLRARGHEAYVISADIPDRGRYYRVRIGPFESRGKAETYRRKFEDEELMHTFVVKQKET